MEAGVLPTRNEGQKSLHAWEPHRVPFSSDPTDCGLPVCVDVPAWSTSLYPVAYPYPVAAMTNYHRQAGLNTFSWLGLLLGGGVAFRVPCCFRVRPAGRTEAR